MTPEPADSRDFGGERWLAFALIQFSSVAQSCPTLCYPTKTAAGQPSLSITNAQSLLLNSCQWCHPTISSSVVPLLWWVAFKNVNKLTVLSFLFFYSGCLTSFRRLPSSTQGERCNKVYHVHWTSWVILHALLAYWLKKERILLTSYLPFL